MPSSTVANATANTPTTTDSTPSPPRRRSVFLRLHWMLFGSAALFTIALIVLREGHSAVSLPSLAMWIVAASMIAARWLDITHYDGLTADGEPASRWHLRRYAIGVGAITAAAWGGALVVG